MIYYFRFKNLQSKNIKGSRLPKPVKKGMTLFSTINQDERKLKVDLQKVGLKENITLQISSK